MIKMDFKETLKNNFKEFESSLNGEKNSEIHKIRCKAFDFLLNNSLPNRQNEEYKYTPLAKELENAFHLNDTTRFIQKEELEKFLPQDLDGHIIVFFNGIFSPDLSSSSAMEGIKVTSDFDNLSDEAIKHFGNHAKIDSDVFTALNSTFSNQGIVVEIEKNKIVEKPFLVLYLTDSDQRFFLISTKNLFIVNENSDISVAEMHFSLESNSHFNSVVTEYVIEENSRVNHLKIQNESENTSQYNHTEVVQKSNAYYECNTISLNGKIVRNNHHVVLNGEGCEAHLLGLYILNGKTHVDNHTLVDHQQPNSFSNELYKGILDGQSTAVFNGKIYVREHAQKTNAFQTNKNILLTNTTKVNTKPQLKIWADDVKCSHGCTTGQLDDEQIFYLQTRGISKDNARAMVLFAFAADIIEKIKFEPIKKDLKKLISTRLQKENG